jgi:PAS domain S-box-containing protein
MDGWLAVPIVGPDDENRGLIQLSDKYQGEFTEADEAILVQLPDVASAAIENARLYDELRESEQRYRTLVKNFPGAAVTLSDEDLRYVAAGGDNVRRVGLTVEDLVGSTLHEALPAELADQLAPHYRAAIEDDEQQSFEAAYRGTYYLFRAVPVRDDSGEVYAGMGISQDITDRQEYQRRLEESNERLEQFASAASHDLQEPLRMVSSSCSRSNTGRRTTSTTPARSSSSTPSTPPTGCGRWSTRCWSTRGVRRKATPSSRSTWARSSRTSARTCR